MNSRRWNGPWLGTLLLLLVGVVAVASPTAEIADAARSRNTEALRALVGKRVDVNAAQADGTTALHWAAHWNDLESVNLLLKAGHRLDQLTYVEQKRVELARALATSPRVLLLDEVAGGLTEHECVALVDLIKAVRKDGVSIIWIEHVVHALLAVVDRLVVLHNGGFIAQGEPHAVIRSAAVTDIYMGIPADA